jgi:hypothetical protein
MRPVPLRFVRTRLLQAGRELRSAGIFRGGVMIILLFLALFVYGFSQLQYPASWVGGIILATIVLMVQRLRFDHPIVAMASNRTWSVYFTEYLVFSSPFLITGLALGSPVSLVLIPLILMISFLPARSAGRSSPGFISSRIPANAFEWRAGFRRNSYMFIILYVLSLVLSSLPYVSLVLLWLLTATFASFFIEGEGREMVEVYKRPFGPFIMYKTWISIKLAGLIVIPPLILHLAFRPGEWIPSLMFFVMMLINVTLFVISKYAIWQPGKQGSVNEMVFSIAIISVVIPFLLPVPLFFLIRNIFRSRKNMKTWLHDFA